MIDDLKYKEGAILSLLKELGPINGQRNLFSLMYLAQKYLGCLSHFDAEGYSCMHGMIFYSDVFGINSNEMRSVLDGLERREKIKVMPSNELDPELLVSKHLIYSVSSRGEKDASESDCLKNTLDKIVPFLEFGPEKLPGIIYLYENSPYTTDWKIPRKMDYALGKRLGLGKEEVKRGFELMDGIGGVRKTPTMVLNHC